MTATWKPFPKDPVVVYEGIPLYNLGPEGEHMVCFQNITPEQLIALTYEYERSFEKWRMPPDSEDDVAYDPADVLVRTVALTHEDSDEWGLYWGPANEEHPIKDRLAIVLTRW